MSETRACIRGCSIRGRHAAGVHLPCECDCHLNAMVPLECNLGADEGCQEQHALPEADCTGCLPRPAEEDEQLCRGCKSRAIRAVTSLGGLADWVRDNVRRGTRRDALDVNYDPVALAPLSIEALADLDELAATLAVWVMLAVEEHPAGLRGPEWVGARIVPASKRHTGHAGTVYDPPRLVGVKAGENGYVVTQAAAWILTHVDWFAAQPWADRWHDELTSTAGRINARWPQQVRARKAPLPCPSCNKITLWWHPAAFRGLDATIICHEDECARRLTESDYWVQVMAKRNTLPKRAA